MFGHRQITFVWLIYKYVHSFSTFIKTRHITQRFGQNITQKSFIDRNGMERDWGTTITWMATLCDTSVRVLTHFVLLFARSIDRLDMECVTRSLTHEWPHYIHPNHSILVFFLLWQTGTTYIIISTSIGNRSSKWRCCTRIISRRTRRIQTSIWITEMMEQMTSLCHRDNAVCFVKKHTNVSMWCAVPNYKK